MAINRKVATTLFSLLGLAIGFAAGWFVFGRNKNLAGKDCIIAGKAGKTDDKGICKAA